MLIQNWRIYNGKPEQRQKRSKTTFQLWLKPSTLELAILQNLIAATNEVDELTMTKLRGECIKEVKKIHGIFTMEKAMDWQSE